MKIHRSNLINRDETEFHQLFTLGKIFSEASIQHFRTEEDEMNLIKVMNKRALANTAITLMNGKIQNAWAHG